MTKLSDLTDFYKDERKKLVDHCEKHLLDVFDDYFKNKPDINTIIIRGYTPAFNDGDPCVHSHYVVIGNEEISEYIHYFDLEYFMENKSDEGWDRNLDSLEDILHDIYLTNWQLLIQRGKPGESCTITKRDYDCGH